MFFVFPTSCNAALNLTAQIMDRNMYFSTTGKNDKRGQSQTKVECIKVDGT